MCIISNFQLLQPYNNIFIHYMDIYNDREFVLDISSGPVQILYLEA